MVSFAFVLCSTLLLSSAIGAPFLDDNYDIYDFVSKLHVKDIPTDMVLSDISVELQRSLNQEASQAGVKVLTDLLDGKDLHKSLLDRSIEALGNVDGSLVKFGRFLLQRLRELINGVPIEKVAGNIWKAVHDKFVGKNKTYDELVEAIGVENVTKFVEYASKVVKDYIISAINKKKEQKALKAIQTGNNAAGIPVAGH